jgi:hypothetical protein
VCKQRMLTMLNTSLLVGFKMNDFNVAVKLAGCRAGLTNAEAVQQCYA